MTCSRSRPRHSRTWGRTGVSSQPGRRLAGPERQRRGGDDLGQGREVEHRLARRGWRRPVPVEAASCVCKHAIGRRPDLGHGARERAPPDRVVQEIRDVRECVRRSGM